MRTVFPRAPGGLICVNAALPSVPLRSFSTTHDMTQDHWTSYRRVQTSLNHQEPDRVPYDLGGTILTGIHVQAYRRLRQHLGLPDRPIEIEDPIQQLARVDEDVKELFQVDVYGINPGKPRGIATPSWAENGYDKLVDEWGIEWWKPQDGGFYFDMRRHPLAEIDTIDGLAKYRFPIRLIRTVTWAWPNAPMNSLTDGRWPMC